MPRWIPMLVALVIGIALGLMYGWLIDPVQYTDITPEALRADFRTDYTLMVAEAFRSEQDPVLASRRLAILGSEHPSVLAGSAYDYARQANYASEDLTLLQELAIALQTWQTRPGTALP